MMPPVLRTVGSVVILTATNLSPTSRNTHSSQGSARRAPHSLSVTSQGSSPMRLGDCTSERITGTKTSPFTTRKAQFRSPSSTASDHEGRLTTRWSRPGQPEVTFGAILVLAGRAAHLEVVREPTTSPGRLPGLQEAPHDRAG